MSAKILYFLASENTHQRPLCLGCGRPDTYYRIETMKTVEDRLKLDFRWPTEYIRDVLDIARNLPRIAICNGCWWHTGWEPPWQGALSLHRRAWRQRAVPDVVSERIAARFARILRGLRARGMSHVGFWRYRALEESARRRHAVFLLNEMARKAGYL